MNKTKLSILLPVFGVEKYIERCAISFFEQTCDDVEFIFVNDCTRDHSIDILQSVLECYDNIKTKVKIINHEQNRGLAGARLTGLMASKGEYIWFVDSDDYVEIDAVSKISKYLDGEIDLLVFNYDEVYEDRVEKVHLNNLTINNVLTFRVPPSIWKCVMKRSLFFDNGILPIEGVNHSEDFVLLSRLLLKAKNVVFRPELCLYHYVCTNSGSYMQNITKKSADNMADGMLHVFDYYSTCHAEKNYASALSYALLQRFYLLYNYDEKNIKLQELRKRLRHTSRCLFVLSSLSIFLHSVKLQKLVLDFYRKIFVKHD